jgi:Ni,Fe-hydrogenase III large subunit
MTLLTKTLAAGRVVASHAPWPRVVIDAQAWQAAAWHLADGEWTLLGLWGEAAGVHMAVLADAEVAVFSVPAEDSRFPSIGRVFPPAQRLERAVHDLFGLVPDDAPDVRPWLDHGSWGISAPLGTAHPAADVPAGYAFLLVEGEDLHEIPVGPVHAGVIEPGHFRFTADGETVVRLEQRLGYTHKGLEGLLAGSDIAHAARLAGRASGDSTVAYAFAFARAVEAAGGLEAPPRAVLLRGVMAELERLANHLGDFGAICNDAAFGIIHMHTGMLRERVLRAAATCFGHRMMMDRIVPGGVARDLDADGIETIRAMLRHMRPRLHRLVELYDQTASLQDRTVKTGILKPALARMFGCGGPVGRASGRTFDTRRDLAYPPYDTLRFAVAGSVQGDVNARVWVRIQEIQQSAVMIEQMLGALRPGELCLPDGAFAAAHGREGMALVESFRGDVLAWVRLADDGRIARCHLRDPSWFQWPLLEAAIEGNIVADFPLCNKSFNCSYSGHDL